MASKIKNTVDIDVNARGTAKAAKGIEGVTKAQTRQTSAGVSASKQFSAQAQQEIFEEDFETKMQAEIDLFEAGQRKKDYQNQLLSVMFGGS